VQDALISILSEKSISVPELGKEVQAKRGFCVIATANTRDMGVNDMSAALKRRFNVIVLPPPKDLATETMIVSKRVKEIASSYQINAKQPESDSVEKVVTIFRELRQGQSLDSKQKIKQPTGAISTAEAISLLTNAMALASSFGNGSVSDEDVAAGLAGAVIKDEDKDRAVWREYLENIMKHKGRDWQGLYKACKQMS
jgi:MoxR-like ATPase